MMARKKKKLRKGQEFRQRAIKVRIYPTEEQKVLLAKTFGCCRFIWNNMLADEQRFYNETDIYLDKWYPSSKTCHHCGYINSDLTLSNREWVCPGCGKTISRDLNAALNIRDAGIDQFYALCV